MRCIDKPTISRTQTGVAIWEIDGWNIGIIRLYAGTVMSRWGIIYAGILQ